MNPNDVDGWFGIVGLDAQGKLTRAPHPWGVYGLLSRYAPSRSIATRSCEPERRAQHNPRAPSGERTIRW
jgi:hypothetical protein